ncbi:putative methyltransferase DDB_G0268948 [Genypterus blacodes]|uniref:putative methyltransferase DDB_G0268948 n=1 Tax=Genypterus blacodes TaxID=154954 RepID=UPI003F759431
MTHRLFDGREHASVYQKYRFTPPDELKEMILQYLDEKKGKPHTLAVDLGCGTGQNSRLLAPYFQEVVGVDISECQLKEAMAVPGHQNVSYRKGTAEQQPFPDNSVDLLTAASAAHWFDQQTFLAEANRILKARGCMALLGPTDKTTLHYQACGDRLTGIYEEVEQVLLPYTSSQVAVGYSGLAGLYSAIPFPDKERIDSVQQSLSVSLRDVVGFIESWSMFQTYKAEHPHTAEDLLLNTQKRLLKEMGVTSPDTEIEMKLHYYCILASKPA